MRDRNGVHLDGKGGGENLDTVARGENLIRLYYVGEKTYFQQSKNVGDYRRHPYQPLTFMYKQRYSHPHMKTYREIKCINLLLTIFDKSVT